MMKTGGRAELVAYNSSEEAAVSVLSGETDFVLGDVVGMNSVANSGKVRMLAVASEVRLKRFPDVPTTIEAGFPQYIDKPHIGMYVTGGAPMAIVNKLHDASESHPDAAGDRRQIRERRLPHRAGNAG